MPIEVKKIRVEGSVVHVEGLIDGKTVHAQGAAYPYTVGKTPVHKRRYLEQLLTASLVNASHRDEPTMLSHDPRAVDIPGSLIEVIEEFKKRVNDHEYLIQGIRADLERIHHDDNLRASMLCRTFWQRLRWLFTGK